MSFRAALPDRPSVDPDDIRRALARHAGEIDAFKVAALRLYGPDYDEAVLEDGELGVIVEFDYARAPSMFDLLGLEYKLRDLLDMPVHVVSAGGYPAAELPKALEGSVRVL